MSEWDMNASSHPEHLLSAALHYFQTWVRDSQVHHAYSCSSVEPSASVDLDLSSINPPTSLTFTGKCERIWIMDYRWPWRTEVTPSAKFSFYISIENRRSICCLNEERCAHARVKKSGLLICASGRFGPWCDCDVHQAASLTHPCSAGWRFSIRGCYRHFPSIHINLVIKLNCEWIFNNYVKYK